jgi:NAD(P)-dependent dehydrogenase (short-subunit alcohol dehydrogenase family)
MNVAGKTVFITGSTDGVGRYVALQLAAQGANLLIHGRDAARAKDVVDQITRGGKGKATFYQADLSSLADTRRLADRLKADHARLDIFISNAGIGSRNMGPERRVSADGHELRFAVNYLSGFLLAYALLPIIRAAAPSRIVNVASLGQAPMDFDDPQLERGYSGTRAYGQSKLAQITTGFELAQRLDPAEVTVTSLHPSTYMPTKMVLEERGRSVDSLEDGVAATVRLAIDPELEGVTGRFYDRQRESAADPQASDPEARRRLWALSLELTGEPEPAR